MTIKKCDKCGMDITDANPIVSKLFIAPVLPGKTRSTHSHYTGHMDIGKCCFSAVAKVGRWQQRKTRTVYNNDRRLRPDDADKVTNISVKRAAANGRRRRA